jgi:hypothetical protein
MNRCAFVVCTLLLAASAYSQPSKQRPRHDTWYEQALRRINPDNTYFGSIWENRKQAFLNQLENRYFQYSFGATVAIVALLTMISLQRVSHNRALEIAVRSIADILRHDEHSRQAAREAIRRYNEHIETCNRIVEVRQNNLVKATSATEAELQRINQELADTRKENSALRNDLAQKSKIIAGMTPPSTAERDQPVQTEMEFASPAQYIARINELEKQLRAERRKNQQMKGTSVHDHRA